MCSSHEIQATLNALGYLEDGEYFKGRDCLNAAKDLIKYLRRDDPTEKTIRRELLKSDTISNDLIPLLKTIKPKKETDLFDLSLRLLVNLTQSALNSFEQKVPDDKIQYNIFIEIDNRLRLAKESFADEAFITVLCARMNEVINKEWQDRREEEELILERILYLIRNILLIKNTENDEQNRLESDLNSHDQLILCFSKSGLLDIIINMIESNLNTKYTIHLLEIITLLLREQSAEELARVNENEANRNSKRSNHEKEKDNSELAKIQLVDNQMRKINKHRLNPRHSRFMGTYVAVNMKSINDENQLIVHKQAKNMDDLLDDSSKKIARKPKNRIVVEGDEQTRKSVLYIRIILKKFCTQFLDKVYGRFFKSLKDLYQRKKLEDDETCQYFSLIQFFTEFTRNLDNKDEQSKLELLKETFCLELFHSIEVFIQRCIEMMRVEKKQDRVWARRMHMSVKCYKENMQALFVFERKLAQLTAAAAAESQQQQNPTQLGSQEGRETQGEKNLPSTNLGDDDNDALPNLDDTNVSSSILASSTQKTNKNNTQNALNKLVDEKFIENLRRIKDQLFYIQEFREMFIMLLKDFDRSKMSKNFLRDLIEANHIYLQMLEEHKKSGSLNVQCKKKKKKTVLRKKATKKKKKKLTKEEKEARKKRQLEYEKRVAEQSEEAKTKAWESNSSRIAGVIQNLEELKIENDNLMPFDFFATNDAELEAQKDTVVEKIQRLLVDGKPDDSIALFREARFLFANDRQLFGFVGISADDEYETYKELIMKKLDIKKPVEEDEYEEVDDNQEKEKKKKKKGKKEGEENEEEKEGEENEEEKNNEDDKGEDEEGNDDEEAAGGEMLDEEMGEEEEEEGGGFVVEEENLDFERFLFRYTHPQVLKSYILMLGEYAKNSDFLNRCCMSMFERIAYECKAPQCLYQLSLFSLINRIYKDPLSRCIMSITDYASHKPHRSIEELLQSKYSVEDMLSFFRSLLRSFFDQVEKNPKLYLEVLFFKDKKIIFELGENSAGYQPPKEKKEKKPKEVKEKVVKEIVEKPPKKERKKSKKLVEEGIEGDEENNGGEMEGKIPGKKRKARQPKKKKSLELNSDENSNSSDKSDKSSKSSKSSKSTKSTKSSENDAQSDRENETSSLLDTETESEKEDDNIESDENEDIFKVKKSKSKQADKEKEKEKEKEENLESSSTSTDSDDDIPLKDLVKTKRQRLILSDEED